MSRPSVHTPPGDGSAGAQDSKWCSVLCVVSVCRVWCQCVVCSVSVLCVVSGHTVSRPALHTPPGDGSAGALRQ